MLNMDMKRLEDIQARCDAATPAPWRVDCARPNMYIRQEGIGGPIGYVMSMGAGLRGWETALTDANFISNARQDIPNLLAELTHSNKECGMLWRKLEEKDAEIAQLRADLASNNTCCTCVHYDGSSKYMGGCFEAAKTPYDCARWQWRGDAT